MMKIRDLRLGQRLPKFASRDIGIGPLGTLAAPQEAAYLFSFYKPR
jgi:hypothetical protein